MLKIVLLFALPALLAAISATSLALTAVTKPNPALVPSHLHQLQSDLALP